MQALNSKLLSFVHLKAVHCVLLKISYPGAQWCGRCEKHLHEVAMNHSCRFQTNTQRLTDIACPGKKGSLGAQQCIENLCHFHINIQSLKSELNTGKIFNPGLSPLGQFIFKRLTQYWKFSKFWKNVSFNQQSKGRPPSLKFGTDLNIKLFFEFWRLYLGWHVLYWDNVFGSEVAYSGVLIVSNISLCKLYSTQSLSFSLWKIVCQL